MSFQVKFQPKEGWNNILDTVCQTLQNLPLESTDYISTKQNLPKEETNTLKSLASDKYSVTKGGAVVNMNTIYYRQTITYMLFNIDLY